MTQIDVCNVKKTIRKLKEKPKIYAKKSLFVIAKTFYLKVSVKLVKKGIIIKVKILRGVFSKGGVKIMEMRLKIVGFMEDLVMVAFYVRKGMF